MTRQWNQLGKGFADAPGRKKTLDFEVAVIGGGIAGICAAVASARQGAKTILVQNRPVLGGNSSSEIRAHVNGVEHLRGTGLPERETGIIEELLLHDRFLNPQASYPLWDHSLYDFVIREPGLELMLNTQCTEAVMSGSGTIRSARCMQLTTEMHYTVNARVFIDCSGDGLLAASAGALFRTGREASSEFDEKYAPEVADGWQMGPSILMESKDMGKPTPYTPPSFAIKYDAVKSHRGRTFDHYWIGPWWIEVGSDLDIIADQDTIRQKLMGYVHGVWDYIKNSGKFPEAEDLALDWVGNLPGPRESRRFIGDFILSEKDLLEHRLFDDAVAYGGWSLDEHCPGGIENLREPPSYFHEGFAEVYQIPYRCLYSKNVPNLLLAGRNVSQTHIAMSSTRVQGTTALMGQAAGAAAGLCIREDVLPREAGERYMDDIQEQLLRDDAFIPKRPSAAPGDLARRACAISASSTMSGDVGLLTDGWSRDIDGEIHHWQSDGLPAQVQLEWAEPVALASVEVKCDTNLQRIFGFKKTHENVRRKTTLEVPGELLKSLECEAYVDGEWVEVGAVDANRTRLVKFRFDQVNATSIRISLKETYGACNAKLFEVRCYGGPSHESQ